MKETQGISMDMQEKAGKAWFYEFFCKAKSLKKQENHEIGGVAGRRPSDGRAKVGGRGVAGVKDK